LRASSDQRRDLFSVGVRYSHVLKSDEGHLCHLGHARPNQARADPSRRWPRRWTRRAAARNTVSGKVPFFLTLSLRYDAQHLAEIRLEVVRLQIRRPTPRPEKRTQRTTRSSANELKGSLCRGWSWQTSCRCQVRCGRYRRLSFLNSTSLPFASLKKNASGYSAVAVDPSNSLRNEDNNANNNYCSDNPVTKHFDSPQELPCCSHRAVNALFGTHSPPNFEVARSWPSNETNRDCMEGMNSGESANEQGERGHTQADR